jgi:HEPN domain-containing protein
MLAGRAYTAPDMARATLSDAREITPTIVTVMDPQAVLVFGGVGRSGEGNDLDLLIVVDENSASEDVLATALQPFQRRISIDPFVITANTFRDHFLRGSPFLRAIVREGRRLYMKNAVSEWMKDARDELKAAEHLHAGGFWKLACFHAQQAIEKAFKARLLGKGWELEKVHSLARLVALAIDHNIPSTLEAGDIQFMDSIYRGRYPGEAGLLPLGEPTRDDAERAIETARKVL